MSLQTPSTYNPEAVILVIGGIPIDGFASEGLDINQEAESEVTEGMDSGVTFEWHPSSTAMVTVTLRAASAGAKRLRAIQDVAWASLRAHGPHPNLAGVASDPINGTLISAGNVFFLNKPLANLAMQSGTVEFKLAFVNYSSTLAANL